MNSELLFELVRNEFSEVQISGFVCIHDGEKVLYRSSDWDPSFPARSLLKPIQFLATGGADSEEVREKLASCMGSLSALPEQVEKMKEWFSSRLILAVKAPACFPMDERARFLLREKGEAPHVAYQPCLGKHLGILTACEKNNWDLETYLSENHPYHKKLNEKLLALLPERKTLDYVTDGCLLPSPVLAISEMARLYQRVAEGSGEFKKIQDLMVNYPEWIGGKGRFDTKLVEANSKKVIAKEGADGLLGVGLLPNAKYPRGLGIVAKLQAGYLPNHMMMSLAPVLKALGIQTVDQLPKGQSARYHYVPFQKRTGWLDASPLINEKLAVWPEDVGFKRSKSSETASGSHMTVSSIQTTVHLGTHTDAYIHFENIKEGIESADLSKYIGMAQVIEVKKELNESIHPEDLKGISIQAERVLFKTSSYPDPARFNADFVSLTKELVAYLAERGVKLVGIDTPSIDPFTSKELPTHHETYQRDIGILEGLVLRDVAPGLYFMSALPLKIDRGDASPVRVLLFKK